MAHNDVSAPIRYLTATALFDGHDASINMIRRLLHAAGCEVIHLGHNRSVNDVVTAALDEDVDAIAVSSYQGGHMEYFTYLVEELARHGRSDIQVVGGGGGVIVASEIEELHGRGVARIFSPADGSTLGLDGMSQVLLDVGRRRRHDDSLDLAALTSGDRGQLALFWSAVERNSLSLETLASLGADTQAPVLGITGTGGSGKSSLTDELLRRIYLDDPDLKVAVIAIDPSRRRGGGALLGDRIRFNSLRHEKFIMRSVAARGAAGGLPEHVDHMVQAARSWGADLVIVETPGIGQSDGGVDDISDVSLYVMTGEYGAASQLEKIEMLTVADVVAVNKCERRGSLEAIREVRRVLARRFGTPASEDLPVFGTVAAAFADDGVTGLYRCLVEKLTAAGLRPLAGHLHAPSATISTRTSPIIPLDRQHYLGEITRTVREYHAQTEQLATAADDAAALRRAQELTGIDLGATPDANDDVELATSATITTLSGTTFPVVVQPRHLSAGEKVRYRRRENLPGSFPFTAGVFPSFQRDEEPTRMFAGEGDAARTNKRFHLLASGQPATRLSTAFDSVTLYGQDPDRRPDIYGKIGNAGVSIATLDEMRTLFSGFDLLSPTTSVSMTINGPAPTVLAMFLNVVMEQAVEKASAAAGRDLSDEEITAAHSEALTLVRGTVQADILKEDQGQNTCLLSTDFSLRMMADVQEWFVAHQVKRFYSVSVSGYHIAEAGANPISQLAFTLSNGFTYLEAWMARGLSIDDIAPSLSFFFSNGMDLEYTVMGRVARRIWAIALRDRYGANERSQRLKYHVQTSGRSLHAQEMNFNDIRTTLQALCAIYDRANSLHTNAYDEAVSTPTDESVRRAMAIQLIINREWGPSAVANPLQGSYMLEELTDLVEEAVLAELDAIDERGGVLGAMEWGYQRGKIQDESLLYESRKHDGSLPLIGVNTFVSDHRVPDVPVSATQRSTTEEKDGILARLASFHEAHRRDGPAVLAELQQVALAGGNTFEVLMRAVRSCSLGEITTALFDVGGTYRRNL